MTVRKGFKVVTLAVLVYCGKHCIDLASSTLEHGIVFTTYYLGLRRHVGQEACDCKQFSRSWAFALHS